MPTYQIDTGKGVLEVDHDGPLSDLHGAVQSWMDERDPQKQFNAGMAVQQATLPQEGTNLAPGQIAEDRGPSFLPKKYAYDDKGAVEIPYTQQEIADANQYQHGDTPILSIPPLQGDQFAGLNAVTGALSSFTTPKNIGMLAGAGVGGAIGIPAKLIAGAFAVDMGKNLVSEAIPEVRDAVIATGWTSPETGAALAGAGLTGLMTAGAAGHAMDGRPLGGREAASMAESLREKLIPSIQSEAAGLKQKVFESDANSMAKDFISKIKPPEISKSDVDGALSEMLGEKPNVTEKVTEQPISNEQTKTEGVPGVSPPAESVQLPAGKVTAPAVESDPVISKAEAAPAETGATAQKLPWEMTKSDYVESQSMLPAVRNVETGQVTVGKRGQIHAMLAQGKDVRLESGWSKDGKWISYNEAAEMQPSPDAARTWKRLNHDHQSAVTIAVAKGKPVPESVLADYPGLKPTPAETVSPKADSLPTKGAVPTSEKIGAAPTSDYQGGPGAMGPVEAADMQASQTKVGISHAAVDDQRAGRDNPQPPTEKPSQPTGAETHATIEAKIEADPELPERIVRSVTSGEKKVFDADETAIVRWHINDLTNKLKMEQDRLAAPDSTPAEQSSALEKANDYAARLSEAEQASASAGSAQGSAFRGRQDAINSDYTFGGLMRKAMNDRDGSPLEPAERAKIAEQAKQIEELQAKVQEETAKSETARVQAERASLLEATVNDLKKQEADRPKYGKQVFEVAHKIVAKWKTEADEAWAFLNEGPKTVSSGGLSTKELVAWAKVLRGYVGEYGLDFAEASARVIERLGNNVPENIGDTLKKAWVKVQSLIDSEATTKETKRVIKEGVSKPRKGEKTTVDVGARAKAEAAAGQELSQKTAYEAVRAVINSGVKGELEIMQAAHELLLPHFSELTPKELDLAFSEYGKAKFPSKEADKVALAKLRKLRQMASAIEDVKETGATKKSGLQRDKPDADVRQRQAELKAAIEEFGKDIAPSEEQLANKERADLNAAKNSIERLDRQLQGIEDDIKNTPKEKTVELEQFHAERDAMRALRDEIRAAEKPRPSPEEEYNATRLKSIEKKIAEAEARIKAGKYAKRTKPATPVKNPAVLKAEAELGKKKEEIRKGQMEQERKNRTKFQKFTSALANLNRVNVLGHLSVLEHLTGAAVENIVTRPVGTALAQVMRFSKTLNAIRRKASYEGGISAKSEFAGITGTLKSSKALWQKLLHGKSDLDWIHNARTYPKEFMEIVSNTHGAIKEPVRQGIYSRSLQLRMEAAEKMGLNPSTDSVLQQTLSAEAYRDANMDIFMGDNFLTKALHNNVNAYLRGQKGDPGLAKFTADVLDILFPIVNVSTNIAIRKFRLAAGLPEATIRIGSEVSKGNLKNGAANLEPRDAELITKSFKYGLFGAGLAVFAWKNPQYFGGIYVPGKQAPKDKESGLELGEIALPGGGHISHHLAHGPVGGYMNQIADARRLYDKEIKDNPENRWSAMSEAAFFSMFSGAKDLPAFSTISRLSSPFKSAGQKAGEMLRNILIFGGIQDVAKAMDDKERAPKTFVQEMASGIPGARSTIPEKKEEKKKHH